MKNSVSEALDRLGELVRSQGLQSWKGLKFVLSSDPPRTTTDLRDMIFDDEIMNEDKAEDAFAELWSTGCSWLHLSCAGLLDGHLLVLISRPHCQQANAVPQREPAVNIAGMQRRVIDRAFDASAAVLVQVRNP